MKNAKSLKIRPAQRSWFQAKKFIQMCIRPTCASYQHLLKEVFFSGLVWIFFYLFLCSESVIRQWAMGIEPYSFQPLWSLAFEGCKIEELRARLPTILNTCVSSTLLLCLPIIYAFS